MHVVWQLQLQLQYQLLLAGQPVLAVQSVPMPPWWGGDSCMQLLGGFKPPNIVISVRGSATVC